MFRSLRSTFGLANKKKPQRLHELCNKRPLNVECLEGRNVPAAFTPGNLVLLRYGDGATLLSAAATNGALVELTTTGANPAGGANVINIPTQATANSGGVTFSGNQSASVGLNLSQNGRFLTTVGYDAPLATGAVGTTTSAAANRNIVQVDANGTVTVPVRLTDALSGNAARDAITTDGTQYWLIGQPGVRMATPSASPTTSTSIGTPNSRTVALVGGNLLYTTQTTINRYTGLPTTAATATSLGLALSDAGQFVFLDRQLGVGDPSFGGSVDTLYVSNNNATNTIAKYFYNGTAWTAAGVAPLTGASFYGLTGKVNGSAVDLFATTNSSSTSSLQGFTDTAAYDATIAGTFTSLGTAGANYWFRGIAFAPTAGLPASTTTVVGDPASPQNQGTSVTFTATVSGSPGDGTVTFYAGPGLTNQIGNPVNVVNGTATSAATTTLPGGSNTVSAVYSGGAALAGSTGTTTYFINANTTTTVAGNPTSPQQAGTSVTFTATITGNPSVGAVTFYAGPGLTNPIGSPVNVVSGTATSAATTTLPLGSNTISAVYSGGTGFVGSTGTTSYVITSAPLLTTTTVVSANPSGARPYGTQITFIATVTSTGNPTGMVNFSDGATVIGSAPLNGSHVASFTTTTPLVVGIHTISAFYVGDAANGSSTGNVTATITYAPGDLIVTRVGTGAALSANATASFLDNYTPTGTANTANTVTLPVASGNALTLGGTTTTEGYLNLSADGHSLSFGGYNQVPGSATTNANRVVGVLSPTGGLDTSTQMPSATGSPRAALSADGQGFWIASTTGLRYVPLGNPAATASTQVSSFFTTLNGVAISPNGQLYLDAGAGAQTATGIPAIDGPATVGTGLPTNAGQSASILLGFPTASIGGVFPTPNQFAISPDGNTIFVADSRTTANGGLLEFFQGTPGQWTNVLGSAGFPIGTPGADSGLRGLSVDFTDPANPIIYGTTTAASGNRLVKITGGTTDGNTPSFVATTLATAPANQAFRGVSLAPEAAGTNTSNVSFHASAGTGDYGTGVTLTATVNQGASGWVSFRQNGVEIGAAPIIPGPSQFDMANFVTAGNLGAGTYDIVAVYTGNDFFAPSTSAPQSVKINKVATTTDLALSSSAVGAGSNVTLTATITVPAGTSPGGTVTFFDGATPLNTTPATITQVITGGVIKFQATFAAPFTTLGSHNVTAVYSGDTNFLTSTSAAQTVTVVSPSTTTVTTSNPNPAATGAPVTLTATVTGPAATPTGSVQFYDNLLPIGSPITLSGGVAMLPLTTNLTQSPNQLTPGLHSISAIYTPDAASQGAYTPSTGIYQQAVKAQPFGANDQFVYRVGDGTTPLTVGTIAVGSTIFVDEYTPAGVLVQSLILPSADGTGTQSNIHAVVGSGVNSNVGQITRSGDGRYLFLAGYDTNVLGATSAVTVVNNAIPRAVARIRFDGAIETEAFVAGANGVNTGGSVIGVYSPDGNQFYLSGFNGVYYFSSFAPSTALVNATATVTATSFTVTGLGNAGGNLVAVGGPTGAGASSNLIQQYTGLPTATATLNPFPGVNNTTDPGQTLFTIDAYFTHLNGAGAPAGINTFYLSDDGPSFVGGKITKWSLIGGTWMLTDTITAGVGNTATTFYWLNGVTDASGNVTLYTTFGSGGGGNTGPGNLFALADTNGFNAPIGTGGAHSDALTTVASVPSGTNTTFRGVASAPQTISTTTTLVATPNASTGGTLVTFTATVAPSPGAAGTVTFKDNGAPITGGVNVPVVGGAASFQISSLSVATHPISADYSGDAAAGYTASTSNTLSYVVSPAAQTPTILSVTPNGSTVPAAFQGAQRSRVVGVTVVFSQAVQLDANAMAIALHTNSVVFANIPRPTGLGTVPSSVNVSTTDNITWAVTFAGAGTVETGTGTGGVGDTQSSLVDGVYDLKIDAAKVHPLGTPGVNMANSSTTTFHRLFGDLDTPAPAPDGSVSTVVNTGDNIEFRTAFNRPAPDYKAYFDFDGSGIINTGDNLAFRDRFNQTLSWKV